MESDQLTIIIPAFNEGENIGLVLSSLEKKYNIIVVNDGSTDNTAEILEKFNVITLHHKLNKGYENAFNTGFRYAYLNGFKYAITFDADGQHSSNDIEKIIRNFNKGFQVVVGSRSYKQRLSEYIFAFFTYLKWGIEDPLCGLKGYDLKIYGKLGHFDDKRLVGTELLLFALKNKLKVEQFKIKSVKREGKSRYGNSIKSEIKIFTACLKALIY